ncbi:hypothetical protein BJG93_17850 [Paraburkholderia sprentiae WSM5005]|uniref:Uncharacterized protein n=1 Tax=Paraburkholderia sprentiae WSM5005 TaxID=754502 RepID=A0A1I9YM45_9BURK|nr:hypothetical protein [Paraburkholderia sprentiae]APA87378.1 hypothetical protein BJG93_17850 [Paraburkholderia sprentiae WSM5005]
MSVLQLGSYKGFELYPLVFSRPFARFDAHSRYSEGYDVAVRICRVGASDSRVFRLQLRDSVADFGVARRTAYQRGRDIIDGKVDGASVADL